MVLKKLKKKKLSKEKKISLADKDRKRKEKLRKENKENYLRKRNKLKLNGLYCKIFINYVNHYNLYVSTFKLFTILSLIYVTLQVAIPDYKNYKIGGERESRFSYLITDFYNDTKSLEELIV